MPRKRREDSRPNIRSLKRINSEIRKSYPGDPIRDTINNLTIKIKGDQHKKDIIEINLRMYLQSTQIKYQLFRPKGDYILYVLPQFYSDL